MKIKQAMKELEELEKLHGNIEIALKDEGGSGHINKVNQIKLIQVKKHNSNNFFRTDFLQDGCHGERDAFIQPYQSKIEKRPDIPMILFTDYKED